MNAAANPSLRRTAVVIAAILVMAAAVGTVQLAAAWRADAAPLTEAPVRVDDLRIRAEQEAERTDALLAEVAALGGQLDALRGALETADGQIAGDAEVAAALRTSLDAAQVRLVQLEGQLAAARTRLADPAPVAAAPARGDDDDEHEEEDEDED